MIQAINLLPGTFQLVTTLALAAGGSPVDGDVAPDNIALEIEPGALWVEFDGVPPFIVPENEQLDFDVVLNLGVASPTVGQFVLSDQKGQSVLHIGNKNASDWDHARKLVARHLAKNPHAVVVLHDADKAPAERLYDLEDAFETPYLQDEGVRIACASTVFILVSSLGQQLKTSICDDVCTPSHRFRPYFLPSTPPLPRTDCTRLQEPQPSLQTATL